MRERRAGSKRLNRRKIGRVLSRRRHADSALAGNHVPTRHAARGRRNRAAETNPMNDPSGDFEKKESGLLMSAESGSDAREQTQAHQATAEEVNNQVRRHALRRTV